jgi:hypothetical protein
MVQFKNWLNCSFPHLNKKTAMDTSRLHLMQQQLFGMDLEDKLFIVEEIITGSHHNKEMQLQQFIALALAKKSI